MGVAAPSRGGKSSSSGLFDPALPFFAVPCVGTEGGRETVWEDDDDFFFRLNHPFF